MASKVIIVTGASRGIGLATATYLLQASHKVVLVSRTQDQLLKLKGEYPAQVEYVSTDLTNLDVSSIPSLVLVCDNHFPPGMPGPVWWYPIILYLRDQSSANSPPQIAPQIVDLAIKSFGRLDGIVINHGVISPMERIADSDVEEWKKLYDANFFSAVALVRRSVTADLPQMSYH
jgi:NADP-dependent 3-hydroxy acid dehydrogenase YdfG